MLCWFAWCGFVCLKNDNEGEKVCLLGGVGCGVGVGGEGYFQHKLPAIPRVMLVSAMIQFRYFRAGLNTHA